MVKFFETPRFAAWALIFSFTRTWTIVVLAVMMSAYFNWLRYKVSHIVANHKVNANRLATVPSPRRGDAPQAHILQAHSGHKNSWRRLVRRLFGNQTWPTATLCWVINVTQPCIYNAAFCRSIDVKGVNMVLLSNETVQIWVHANRTRLGGDDPLCVGVSLT